MLSYDSLVLIVFILYAHDDTSGGTRGVSCGASHHLHPYFEKESSKGSGESAHAQTRLTHCCLTV